AMHYWPGFFLGVLATLVSAGLDGTLAFMIKSVVAEGLVNRTQSFLMWIPIGVVLFFCFRGISSFLAEYYIYRTGRKVVLSLRKQLFAHLLTLPISFYDQHKRGNIITTILYNTEQVASATTSVFYSLVKNGALVILLFAAMMYMSWQLTLACLLITPFIGICLKTTATLMRKHSVEVQDKMGIVSQVSEECLKALKITRLYGANKIETNKFNTAVMGAQKQELRVIRTSAISSGFIQFIVAIPVATAFYLFAIPNSPLSAGTFMGFLVAMVRVLSPLRSLSQTNMQLQKGIAATDSIFSYLELDGEAHPGSKKLGVLADKVEFKQICFTYASATEPTLQDISFTIPIGKRTAIVGKSGSGKSTILNLLTGLYAPTSGEILFDGESLTKYSLASLRKQIALVTQDVILFNDSIMQNIAYGDNKPNLAKVKKVAIAAKVDDFVQHLENGYDSIVGQEGCKLSGGQKQRIAIARALYHNCQIIILDEATSSLDIITEKDVHTTIMQALYGKTVIIVAHRLNTIREVDNIYVLNQGKIIESGQHDGLILNNGAYQNMYYQQSQTSNV
nr:ATP-binding cassette domain-containing protein [Gammaproteobacteria bacterium]